MINKNEVYPTQDLLIGWKNECVVNIKARLLGGKSNEVRRLKKHETVWGRRIKPLIRGRNRMCIRLRLIIETCCCRNMVRRTRKLSIRRIKQRIQNKIEMKQHLMSATNAYDQIRPETLGQCMPSTWAKGKITDEFEKERYEGSESDDIEKNCFKKMANKLSTLP